MTRKIVLLLLIVTFIIIACAACNSENSVIICSNCAEKVPESSKYCPSCGVQLFAGSDSPTDTPTLPLIDSQQNQTTNATTIPTGHEQDHEHTFSAATCTEQSKCECGEIAQEALGHDWKNATCTDAETCTRCNQTNGSALGHNWSTKSCSNPSACTRCGKSTGNAGGHDWKNATCTEAKTCARCKETEGNALGHKWSEATCTEAKICTRCNQTNGSALGHNWTAATCTTAKTCARCQKTEGGVLGHTYQAAVTPATCTTPGYTTYTCSCGDSYISDPTDAGHKYNDHICTVCGEADETYKAYRRDYNELTTQYNADIAKMQAEIVECNESISAAQKVINNARGELAGLSPTCPQWYLQQYVSNWQIYGSTYAATQAAQSAWTKEYNNKKAQLNNTIDYKTREIQTLQNRIDALNTSIDQRTTQYEIDVQALKTRYGIR